MFALNLLKQQRRLKPKLNLMQTRCKARFKDGGEHATLNDLPIPQGSWKANYDRNQKRYMMVLLTGIASFIGSVLFVANSGKMVFNFTVPDYPYEEQEEGQK